MKKFLVSASVLFIICFSASFCFKQQNLLDINFHKNILTVEAYLSDAPVNAGVGQVTDVGFCYIAKLDKENAKSVLKNSDTCIGMSLELEADISYIPYLFTKLKFKLNKTNQINESLIVYEGTSSLFKNAKTSNTNVQIAVSNNIVKIGSPMILGSF